MFVLKLSLLCLAVILSCCEAYKILVVFPIPGKSHSILGEGYVRNLLNDGHEVTYISAFPYKSNSSNFRLVDVSSNMKLMPENLMSIKAIMNKETDMDDPSLMFPLLIGISKTTIEHENVQKILQNPKEHFDVVIAEWMFTELPAGYAAVFDCPLIWSSSLDFHWAILRLIDQPSNPAYTGDTMSAFLPPYTFVQRVTQLYNQVQVLLIKTLYIDEMERQEYENLLAPVIIKRGRNPPAFRDIQFNGSMILANTHVSLGQANPIPQSAKAVGGYHIEEEVKPLPEDLRKIMDNAKNGVIYFSMGSNLKSKDMSMELKESLLKVFGDLKQTVLWKFEEDFPNTPKNVHILKWAPQPGILAHPNTVVFITHGGLLSTTETIHYGVPIIGIPVFADQFINVARAVQKGYALKVDLSYTMADVLKLAIEEVTTNPKYAQRAKDLSMIFHDRPVSPGQELVHWVKHVIKTRGAPHLRSPALDVPFYQKLYLDLLALILVSVFVIIKLLKCACKTICSKNSENSTKKNN